MSQPQKSFKILLVGDSCYDYYHYGKVKRISPEAPIPIFDHAYTIKKLGMASNVLENFRALGVNPDFQTHFFESKNRYLDMRTNQQLLRVDQKLNEDGLKKITHMQDMYASYDAIVISDYAKGFFSYKDYEVICANFDGPIFIDTKDKYLSYYEGAIVKVNEQEYRASDLWGKNTDQNVIITYGGRQVVWRRFHPEADRLYYPPKVDAYDVCGAGDTFFASLVFEYLRGNSDMERAIRFAMKAAAITVKHIGVYAPTLEEIEHD